MRGRKMSSALRPAPPLGAVIAKDRPQRRPPPRRRPLQRSGGRPLQRSGDSGRPTQRRKPKRRNRSATTGAWGHRARARGQRGTSVLPAHPAATCARSVIISPRSVPAPNRAGSLRPPCSARGIWRLRSMPDWELRSVMARQSYW